MTRGISKLCSQPHLYSNSSLPLLVGPSPVLTLLVQALHGLWPRLYLLAPAAECDALAAQGPIKHASGAVGRSSSPVSARCLSEPGQPSMHSRAVSDEHRTG